MVRGALPIRRTVTIAPLLALCACATEQVSRSELAEQRAELRALRQSNERMEQRIERIEGQQAVIAARNAPQVAKAPPAASAPAPLDVPDLTVVKLKPKADPAPRIDVSTLVVEPPPEVVEALVHVVSEPASSGASDAQADSGVLDAQYNAALEALRTGNVDGGTQRLIAFAQDNPRHPKADNALYFAGLGQIGLADHASAAALFEQLVEIYPAGDAVVEAMLKLAECRVRLNRPREARALYGEVISRYPGTTAASQAEARLSALSP